MKIEQLREAISSPYFTTFQVQKLFVDESSSQINVQLSRMVKRGIIISLKRGVFSFPKSSQDSFILANLLYPQSYVSLESALNTYGVIPDVPSQVTSVTPLTTKQIHTPTEIFFYSKIAKNLYFGFLSVESLQVPSHYYRIAEPEKALLDYIYIRSITNLVEARVDRNVLNADKLQIYARHFPKWVQKVVNAHE